MYFNSANKNTIKDINQLSLFKDFDGYSTKYHFFKNSLFGKIHDSIAWDDLVACLPEERSGRGAPCWFGAKGMFALMFLKAYLNVSDRQLLERYNTDWSPQYFCGKVLAENQQRRKSLVYLLEKGIGQLQEILNSHRGEGMDIKDFARLAIVKKVLGQQRFLLTNPPAALKDRIVSLYKPYIRPIVRGKENKPVEFGAKAHILQVDGLAFLDKLEFKAFNECTRLKLSVTKQKRIFGPARQLGTDRVYATNSNRKFCNKIFTCFPKKGPKQHSNSEKILSSEISTQRATSLKGYWVPPRSSTD